MARSCAVVSFAELALFVAVVQSQLQSPSIVPAYQLVPPYLSQAQSPVFGPPLLTRGPSHFQNPIASPNFQTNPVSGGQQPVFNQNPILEQNPTLYQNPTIVEQDPALNQYPINNQNPVISQTPALVGQDPYRNQNPTVIQNPVPKQDAVLTKDYGGHDPIPSSYAPYPEKAAATPEPSPACILSLPKKLTPPIAGTVAACGTVEDKKCLSLKKVLMDDKCYKLGTPGPCAKSEIVVIDKKIYLESGVLRGACRPIHACDRRVFQEFMSYDKCCYEVRDIEKYVCPSEKNLRLTKNVFGEGECVFVDPENKTSTPEIDFQIQGDNCVLPDLSFSWNYKHYDNLQRFPHLSIRHPLLNISLNCSNEEQRACLAKGQVLIPPGVPGALADPGGCHTLLTRGPCPPGAWLVLDKSAVQDERRISPVCDWARCAPDSVYLAKDQRCVSLWELQHERCSSEDIVFDVFGEGHCVKYTKQKNMLLLPQHSKGDECILLQDVDVGGFAGTFPSPACAITNSNRCGIPGSSIPVKPSSFAG